VTESQGFGGSGRAVGETDATGAEMGVLRGRVRESVNCALNH